MLGVTCLACTILAAVLAPLLSPADPLHNSLLDRLTPPMWAAGGTPRYPLGTDTLGRDVLTRLLYGARVSLLIGLAAVVLAGAVGVGLGLISGYYGGRVDDVLMRLGDIQLAFPMLVLAIAILAVLGASLGNVIVVLGLSGWVTYARIVRGETLSLTQREFVEAARGIGVPDYLILAASYFTERVAPRHRGGDLLGGPYHYCRSLAELSRPRCPSAHTELGCHAR